MLKTRAVTACAFVMLPLMTAATYVHASDGGSHVTTSPQTPGEDGETSAVDFDRALVGTWVSAPDEMKLTSDLDKSVWGVNATSVRTLELTIRPTGDGTLRLTRKVLDGKGRVVPASTWIEEAELKLGPPTPGVATRLEHEARVVKAVRQFADDPDDRWPLDGLRVELVTFKDGDGHSIEVRYDTPEGRGSFWETLTRRQRPASGRATR